VSAIERVVLCSDFELSESFYAQVNARLQKYQVELQPIDFANYEKEENCPLDPIIFFNCPWQGKKLLEYSSLRKAIFLWEPPTIYPDLYRPEILQLFDVVYTWNDTLVDGVHCLKFYYPNLQGMINDVVPFKKKKLGTQVSANKHSPHPHELYSQREAVIQFFESFPNEDFRFYGYGWESCGYRNYGGAVDDKIRTIRQYRFNFFYENIKEIEGYVTEKIFDSFAAGCVPIYWGASNIEHYVPRSCFIDRRDFPSLEALYQFLKNMSEQEYGQYLFHIRQFLKSPQAQVFKREYYEELLFQTILAMAKAPAIRQVTTTERLEPPPDAPLTTEDRFYFERTDPKKVGRLYQMMKVLDAVLEKHQIPYWASGGTALGAVRHGGMIPWDDDIDIEIDTQDKQRLLDLAPELADWGLTLVESNSNLRLFSIGPFPYAILDIFTTVLEGGKIVMAPLDARESWPRNYWFPEELAELTRIPFGPIEIRAAKKQIRYLKDQYGEDVLEIAIPNDHKHRERREAVIVNFEPAAYEVVDPSIPL
jgi:hypothetical protein